jgi:hypothetical protein
LKNVISIIRNSGAIYGMYHKKKFHTTTRPSRPVLTSCLSSGENLMQVMQLEWALHSVRNAPDAKS